MLIKCYFFDLKVFLNFIKAFIQKIGTFSLLFDDYLNK
jgi:hypothetical protein